METSSVFLCDANALINFHRHFSKQTRLLRNAALQGLVRISDGVYRELKKGSDKLPALLENWNKKVSIVITLDDPRLRDEWNRINQKYQEWITVGNVRYRGFGTTQSGKRGVDAQVVAIGKWHGFTVVSDDKAVQSACMLEGVTCITWRDFARRIGIIQQQKNGYQQLEIEDEE
jgi:hypothetical protein